MNIKVLESTMIQPASNTPRQRLWISDLDLLMQPIHIPTTHFYRAPLDGSPDFFDSKKLKESLAKVLVPFYPAAGKLARDENNRIEIDCTGEGALFMVAEAEAAIDEFGDFAPSENLMQLVPSIDPAKDISFYPLFLVQVTHFKCGGVCLGIRIHHFVTDGPSAINLINSWAQLTKGVGINLQPFLDRTLLRPRDPPTPTFPHIEYHPPPILSPSGHGSSATCQSNSPPVAECLRFTKDQLDQLKASAPGYTTFEVLTAHVWRCTCKARGVADDLDSKLYTLVEGRPRLGPPLPLGYFGNAQFTVTPIAAVGDITGRPLAYAASVIRGAVERTDDEYMRSMLDYLALQQDLPALRRGPHLLSGPNLQVVSWMEMAAYEADFGWGRPVFMGRGKVSWDCKPAHEPSQLAIFSSSTRFLARLEPSSTRARNGRARA